MRSFVYHIQINVSNKEKSFLFYKDLLTYLGYKVKTEAKWGLGMTNGKTDLWVIATSEKYKGNSYHRKQTGLNHISFGVEKKNDVDKFTEEFLKTRKIKPIYDSPREFREYTEGYYAVFFEDPDRIKLEVTYVPGFEGMTK